MKRISIIGAGAWGTALAIAQGTAGKPVTLYVRDKGKAGAMAQARENSARLPGLPLPDTVAVTGDLARAVTDADILLLATPTQYLREELEKIRGQGLRPDCFLVLTCKGFELGTGLRPSQIVADILPDHPCAVLSGPSFADEAARGLPCALTLAVDRKNAAAGHDLSTALSTPTLRPYLSFDTVGVETGGAVKNVIAIACGVVTGAGLGENAKAALMTRGLAEISRLGLALGAQAQTFLGLSGIGDLVLTCHSPRSRNFSLGFELGAGMKLDDILAARSSVTEGVTTTPAVLKLASQLGIDMPVTSAVGQLLAGEASLPAIIAAILARPLREERE